MRKIIKLIAAGIVLLLIIQVSINLYNNRSVFDISLWTEKCILCNFENRHHCHLCISGYRKCPFCDNNTLKTKKEENYINYN